MKGARLMSVISSISRKLLGDRNTYKLKYFHQRRRFPNLKDPKDLSERLIAKMFSSGFGKMYSPYADKILVREYVRSKGLSDILLEHYAVWDSPENMSINELPEKFILKANNGCGGHIICRDKSIFDLDKAKEMFRETILAGKRSLEPHYRNIEPKIFAEQLIDLGEGNLPTDYKFLCIKGKVRVIDVVSNRSIGAEYYSLDENWTPLPYTYSKYLSDAAPVKPKGLSRMLELAEILSKDFDFVRVDLYNVNEIIYFGELTFSPEGALLYSYNDNAIKRLGDMFRE